MQYRPHDAFIRPARHTAEIWRTVAGIVLILALYTALLWLFLDAITAAVPNEALPELLEGRSPPGVIMLLGSFVTLALSVILTLLVLHGRAPISLFGPARQALRDGIRVALPVIALGIVLLPLMLLDKNVSVSLSLGRWLLWMPLALPVLLLQVTAEEMAFRGYLQQQLAARFENPLVFLLVPSALFAFGHYTPEDFGANAIPITLWAGVFGLLAADLTARTGTLGAAIGFHFANNVGAVLILSLAGDTDGLAIWRLQADLQDTHAMLPILGFDFLNMVTTWLLARVILKV